MKIIDPSYTILRPCALDAGGCIQPTNIPPQCPMRKKWKGWI